ncbi:MAG: N-acetyl-1-D-myo-inositol-2-amino-2-deoxy-alpha-D-glucopyranoside deacetylase [Actinobacteria bacterium]|jgi:N-acetyl-1-D-myo-inositol-2-amino-2-deoxy-alpha-D-glucopyranoside deacetylase|nr:N-acetyl-1-D-myo-inositol-2-amino-2-deoxy-alpha-D-glucopyranoside deacetylase [Micrococcales bacterium]MCB0902580.1 N-acetyl-1-D-myo-inositol-2-amino-2-deoxy-alpha-D-glucopyranoside deacetylase [Actinomycetota bacterium]MCO5300528.1 N-acetyl-1-D-myo-inositol-2-amino-2-deoxy-alpha-D-glucopyranoside deacetylase [Candidatus Nanopelagicales bacterium]MCB9429249.1 N-acetyl-1-D-myo-inositol-2-amino-2-deoxy-alpha-D-glucopyranoside deacetylase [Actinomycetota bacterium]HPE11267.1 N-acetyl-1-D-myo-in
MADRRLLIVHAHPDDETITTGALMAGYVKQGVQVTLVTCTLGEEGEVLLEDSQHLASHNEDRLGEHRFTELSEAMQVLGVTDWRLLGEPHKYRDSGMMGMDSNNRPDCFWRADLLEAATDLVAVIREVKPQVAVTYDDFGGYGHPDHIQAHRVLTYALSLAAVPSFRTDLGQPWQVQKVYWTAMPKGMIRDGIRALRAAGQDTGFAAMDPEAIPFGVEDSLVTTSVDFSDFLDTKMDALARHASQVQTDGGFFALSNNLGSKAMGVEHFRIAAGAVAGPFDEQGRETDLFNGVSE